MKFHPPFVAKSVVSKPAVGAIVGLTLLGAVCGGAANADTTEDTLAKINDLSRQAEQLSKNMQTSQQDLDRKLQLLSDADRKHSEDLAALDAARAQLDAYQGSVNKLVAAVYMGGRSDGLNAILTATSPKNLIDDLALQRVMNTDMVDKVQGLRVASQQAQSLEVASAESAIDLKAAVDEAVALRADLLKKQSQLESQITAVKADYAMLPSPQRAALAASISPSVEAALGRMPAIPTVGMGGLVPNARGLAAYIMAKYPGVQSIGGVRSDPLPDHPSGRAIDVMIGGDMSLGDAINADIQGQAARFGVSYTMWRVAAHFDHVHITVY